MLQEADHRISRLRHRTLALSVCEATLAKTSLPEEPRAHPLHPGKGEGSEIPKIDRRTRLHDLRVMVRPSVLSSTRGE